MELSYLFADLFKDLKSEVDRFDAVSEKLALAMSVDKTLVRKQKWLELDLDPILRGAYQQPPEVYLGDQSVNAGNGSPPRNDLHQDAVAKEDTRTASSATSSGSTPDHEEIDPSQGTGAAARQENEDHLQAQHHQAKINDNRQVLTFDDLPDRLRQRFMRNFLYQKFNANSLGRGMSYLIEARDNLGGYPVEYSHAGWMTTLLKELCTTCRITKIDELATTGYLITLTALDVDELSANGDENLDQEVLLEVSPEPFGINTPQSLAKIKDFSVFNVGPNFHNTIFTGCYGSSSRKSNLLADGWARFWSSRTQKSFSTFPPDIIPEEAKDKQNHEELQPGNENSPSGTTSSAGLDIKVEQDLLATTASRSCYGVWRRRRAVKVLPQQVLPIELFLENQSEGLIGVKSFLKVTMETVGRHLAGYALHSLLTNIVSSLPPMEQDHLVQGHQAAGGGGGEHDAEAASRRKTLINEIAKRRYAPLFLPPRPEQREAGQDGSSTTTSKVRHDLATSSTTAGAFYDARRFLKLFLELAQREQHDDPAPLTAADFDFTFLAKGLQMYYEKSVDLSFYESTRRAFGEKSLELYRQRVYGRNPFFQGAAYLPAAEKVVQHLGRLFRERTKGGVNEEVFQRPGKQELQNYLDNLADGTEISEGGTTTSPGDVEEGTAQEPRASSTSSANNSSPAPAINRASTIAPAVKDPAFRCFVVPLRHLFAGRAASAAELLSKLNTENAEKSSSTTAGGPQEREDDHSQRTSEVDDTAPLGTAAADRVKHDAARKFFDLQYQNPDLDPDTKFPHTIKLTYDNHFVGFTPNGKTEIAVFVNDENHFELQLDNQSDFVKDDWIADLNFCNEAFAGNRVSEYRVLEFRFVDNGNLPIGEEENEGEDDNQTLTNYVDENTRAGASATADLHYTSGTNDLPAAATRNRKPSSSSALSSTASETTTSRSSNKDEIKTQAQYSEKLLDSATRRLLQKSGKKHKYSRVVKGKTGFEQSTKVEGKILYKTAAVVFKVADEDFRKMKEVQQEERTDGVDLQLHKDAHQQKTQFVSVKDEQLDLQFAWTDDFDPDVCLQDELHKDFLACQSRFVEVDNVM
ncbi:unnamed protein product [Amoebophrya sp. A120]|nr:unnamed protein product [Amoebophrya sp. A120]|eukprot:GSA120T00021037001.1